MSLHIPERENICAVLVTFHPDPGFGSRAARVARQVDAVVIIDNQSGEHHTRELRELCTSMGANLIENAENRGVAAALNQGARWAVGHGYEWMLMLDQDTVVADDMVETLSTVYTEFPANEKLGIIGSNYTDPNSSRALLSTNGGSHRSWQEVKAVITSGSLVRLSLYVLNGPFREEFFIDHVDDEYCLRARSMGFKVLLTCKALMQHSIGATTMHRLPWKRTGTSNHSPARRYYMTRNHLVVAREYMRREPIWVLATVYSSLKSTILVCLFEESRLSKLKYIAMGIIDGLAGNFARKLI